VSARVCVCVCIRVCKLVNNEQPGTQHLVCIYTFTLYLLNDTHTHLVDTRGGVPSDAPGEGGCQ
jgi:hypothetical protein